jgi:urease accessory protein
VHSRARIVADARGGITRLTHLEGDGALTVRPTPMAGRTRVHLVAGAFGPLGGDELTLQIEVGPGATLEVAGVAATVALPSLSGLASLMKVRVDLADGARLELALPPTVVADGARHTLDVELTVAGDASLLLREETIRGRTGEGGGEARLVTGVDVAGRPMLRQDLELTGEVGGPWRPRAVASLLLIGPEFAAADFGDGAALPGCAAWLALPGAAGRQLTAIGDDPLSLSRLLDSQLPR